MKGLACPICYQFIKSATREEVKCENSHYTPRHLALSLSSMETPPPRAECVNSYLRSLHQEILHSCNGAVTEDLVLFKCRWKYETYQELDAASIHHMKKFFGLAGYVVAVGETAIVFALDTNFNQIPDLYRGPASD